MQGASAMARARAPCDHACESQQWRSACVMHVWMRLFPREVPVAQPHPPPEPPTGSRPRSWWGSRCECSRRHPPWWLQAAGRWPSGRWAVRRRPGGPPPAHQSAPAGWQGRTSWEPRTWAATRGRREPHWAPPHWRKGATYGQGPGPGVPCGQHVPHGCWAGTHGASRPLTNTR